MIFAFNNSISVALEKKQALPRFATIKSNEVNARTGPNVKSVIEWVFVSKGEPVEIVAEYEHWREIKDILGEGGWVHVSVLSRKRSVVVQADDTIPIKKAAAETSSTIANAAPNLRCELFKCAEEYCKVSCKGYIGWIKRSNLWGVYKNELF